MVPSGIQWNKTIGDIVKKQNLKLTEGLIQKAFTISHKAHLQHNYTCVGMALIQRQTPKQVGGQLAFQQHQPPVKLLGVGGGREVQEMGRGGASCGGIGLGGHFYHCILSLAVIQAAQHRAT